MEKTLILKHISGMLCLLISYSKFTRTLFNMQLTQSVNCHILIIERSPLTFGNQAIKR